MNKLLTIALAVAVCATVSQAQMVLYEDFESYTANTSIHLQGTDTPGVPRWYAQQNSSALADSGAAIVRACGGNQALELGTSRPNGTNDFDTLGAAMAMKSMEITGTGTIYIRWTANDVQSNMMCTNDLNPGWDYNSEATVDPGTIGADGWQEGYGGEGYSKMGAMFKMGGGINVNARDGGGYVDAVPAIALPVLQWMELWIQVDAANHQAKYFVCPQGGTPVQAMSPDDEWWGNRDQDHVNDSVANLKWIISNWGYTDETPNKIWVDTIGIDTQNMSLDRVGPAELPPIPEPATMSLLALGGLALIRRRR